MNRQKEVAIVTGASRGIGHDLAVVLAEAGFRTVLTARTMAEGESRIPGSLGLTAADVREAGGETLAVPGNIAKEDDRQHLIRSALREFGRIDLLVNNAGIAPPGLVETMKPSHFELAWRVNVEAPFSLARVVLPAFRANGGGAIINVSSPASVGPEPGPRANPIKGGTVYGMTKIALERFTQGLAAELAGEPISVSALSPAKMIYVGGDQVLDQHGPPFRHTRLGRATGQRSHHGRCVSCHLQVGPSGDDWSYLHRRVRLGPTGGSSHVR
jgi:citronellol/citronellal dehydrogenase